MQEIFIVGPTGAGKSEYAKKLFAFIMNSKPASKVAIINADSISFYKYFNIASAKPNKKDINQYNYHGIDIAEASKTINVYDFYQYYHHLKADSDHTHFILVGGSGLYIDSIYYNYSFSDQFDMDYDYSVDNNLFSNLRRQEGIRSRGWHHNVDRVNALPKSIVGLWRDQIKDEHFIVNRFEQMLSLGALNEVEHLLSLYGADNSILQAVNYSSIVSFIINSKSREWLLEDIIKQNRKLIKKQRTWFNRNQDVQWTDGLSDIPSDLLN